MVRGSVVYDCGVPGVVHPHDRYNHVLRQLGLVAMDVVAAAVALATVQSWGRIIPRRLLLSAAWGICGLLAAGLVAFVYHSASAPQPFDWTRVLVGAFLVVWVVTWGVTARSFGRREPRA
ncbi:MAG: hypothetical protein ACRDU8_07710 [Egibacteraceae bacterium]